jgi:hypothetical protein
MLPCFHAKRRTCYLDERFSKGFNYLNYGEYFHITSCGVQLEAHRPNVSAGLGGVSKPTMASTTGQWWVV